MSRINYKKAADILKLFSHPIRLLIVSELLKGRRCVSSINKLIKVRQPNISQHLSILKLKGIIESRQEGKKVCYRLKETELVRSLLKFLKENKLI